MVPTLLKEHLYIKMAVALIVMLAPIVLMDYRDILAKWWLKLKARVSRRRSR
ncbi:hypothetical protein [Caldivirga sp. UBA161]|uniref:hypothetical protein n=1 Tax=Caldivirga sp. UBA161 TaxID=1915569 RepID=UPI0025BD4454|nr:hypothetical protein [Caldivirga sp. UBA161]